MPSAKPQRSALSWLSITFVLSILNTAIYLYAYWEAGWKTPHLGTYLCLFVAALTFAFAPSGLRDRRGRWSCLLGIALSVLLVWHALFAPCVEPCK